MPRRREIPKRELAADPLYNSTLVSKFINTIMSDGKRSTAERILYKSFDIIKERTGDDPLKVFKKALDNVKPSLEVKSRRVGGSNYQVPVEVNPNRRMSLSIRWLVGYARERGDGIAGERRERDAVGRDQFAEHDAQGMARRELVVAVGDDDQRRVPGRLAGEQREDRTLAHALASNLQRHAEALLRLRKDQCPGGERASARRLEAVLPGHRRRRL